MDVGVALRLMKKNVSGPGRIFTPQRERFLGVESQKMVNPKNEISSFSFFFSFSKCSLVP
jgi:hypothetical protein